MRCDIALLFFLLPCLSASQLTPAGGKGSDDTKRSTSHLVNALSGRLRRLFAPTSGIKGLTGTWTPAEQRPGKQPQTLLHSTNKQHHFPGQAISQNGPGKVREAHPPKPFTMRELNQDDCEVQYHEKSAEVHFNLKRADWIPEEVMQQLKSKEKSRISKEGVLVVTSGDLPNKETNLEAAMTKMQHVLNNALEAAKPARPLTAEEEKELQRFKHPAAKAVR